MIARRAVSLFVLSLLAAVQTFAFQAPASESSAAQKSAIEHRFESKRIPDDVLASRAVVPGRHLLDRASNRSARSALTSKALLRNRFAQGQAQGGVSNKFPGIQTRDALPAGAIPDAVVTGDFNGDGKPDFVVANGGTDELWVYLGKGDGTFDLPKVVPLTKGVSPVYMVAADLRGIGVLDLVVAEFDTSTVGVLLGKGDGTFDFEQVYSLPQPPNAIVVDDFNHDGKLDVVAGMYTLDSYAGTAPADVPILATLYGDGTGAFASPIITRSDRFARAWNIASGDVNNDGLPDLVVTGPATLDSSRVYRNNGDGTFSQGQELVFPNAWTAFLDARFADLDNDGCLDVAVADGGMGRVSILSGDCSGNFGGHTTTLKMGDSVAALRLADVNGDGNTDIITSAMPLLGPEWGDVAGDTLSIAFGDGHGSFSAPRDYVGNGESYSLALADFNGDGKLDVVTANTESDSATVYINDGFGAFGFPQGTFIGIPNDQSINSPITMPAFGDLNGDGRPDVVLVNSGNNGEMFVTSALNVGNGVIGRLTNSDTRTTRGDSSLGDFRLGVFGNTGLVDFVAIGNGQGSVNRDFILFMHGAGDGSFTAPTVIQKTGANGTMALGDFDRDGKLDIACVGAANNAKAMSIFLGNGDGTFRNGGTTFYSGYPINPIRVFATDFDRDGKLDIVAYGYENGSNLGSTLLFVGNGDGTFQAPKQLLKDVQPVSAVDLDGNFWLDILTDDFKVFLNQPGGSVQPGNAYAPYAGMLMEPRLYYLDIGDRKNISTVPDLDSDGRIDAIAFQRVSDANRTVYAQIMKGNGDGTFAPTFDIFSFDKTDSFPRYAYDLDGDGRTELVELDGSTASLQVFKSSVAPALQIELEDNRVVRNASCGWVYPNVPSSSDRTVTLSSAVSGVALPGSVTIPANSLSQRFCYTLDEAFDWHRVFDVRAQLGADTAVAYASQAYVVGFQEAITPSAGQVIYASESTQPVSVVLTSSNGYSSTVKIRCEGLPDGASCEFGSTELTLPSGGTASTTLVVHTASTNSGSFNLGVIAEDGNVIRQQSLNIEVAQITILPTSLSVQTTSPGTGTTEFSVYGIPPYASGCSGLPSGIDCSITKNERAYPNTSIFSLSLTAPSGIAAVDYPFKVTVSGGPISKSIDATLRITDFTMQAPVGKSWGVPGSTAHLNASAQAVHGFNSVVSFTCSTDFGGACSGGDVGVAGSSSNVIPLIVSVPSGTSLGVHTVTILGTVGSMSHSLSIPFYVADFGGSLSGASLNMVRGSSGSVTATITATDAFAGTVSLTCSAPTQLTCTLSPSSVQPTAGGSKTVTVTVTSSAIAYIRPRGTDRIRLTLALAVLPFGMVGALRTRRITVRALMLLVLGSIIVFWAACGGGGGGSVQPPPADHGSNSYTVTVKASADGTNYRELGTVAVTVTH